jgi:glycosyltransferase involved in cell wall biosynthesis
MKIGIYFHGYPPEKCGGYSFEREILLSLCEVAGQCRHELVLFFENMPGEDNLSILAGKGVRTVLLEPLWNAPLLQRAISKILGVLHFPSLQMILHSLRAAMKREEIEFVWFEADAYVHVDEVDVPYIATVWDIQHRQQPWFPEVSKSGMWDYREKFYFTFLRRAAYILTPNSVSQKELCLFYGLPPERFRLLPLPSTRDEPIPNEDKVNAVLEKYALTRGYLFYPAGFWAHKNHANLLLALQILKNRYQQNLLLVLVGSDKGNLEYVRNLVKTLGLEDQVRFPGFVPREDLIALYQGAFALTYMSLFGPENIPPLEAFKFGCPVITSDYDGAREQSGDAAFYVNGLDPESIAKAILELKRQPEFLLSLIEKGYKRAARYSGETYIKDVFRIFDEFEAIRRTWGRS